MTRPSHLESTLGYIYIRCFSDGKTLIGYSLPSSESRLYKYYRSPAQVTEMKVLSAASPYRPSEVPRQTNTLTDPAGPSSVTPTNSTSALTRHWSEIPQHFDFLRELQRRLNRRGLQVNQFHEEASDVFAFQIKTNAADLRAPLAFHRTSLENGKCKCMMGLEGHRKMSLCRRLQEKHFMF